MKSVRLSELIPSSKYARESAPIILQIIGADSLAYLDEECLYEMSKGLGICTGCFNGKYPLDPPTEDIRGDYQK